MTWTTGALLAATWTWDPSVIAGVGLLCLVYAKWARPRRAVQAICFTAGALVLLLALISPLDLLGDSYLFSAHMLQHLLLILVTPPLLLLGLPRPVAARLMARPGLARLESCLRRPLLAWSLGVVAVWAWHAPRLYNAALLSEPVHLLEHLMFLATATIFWWPILSPLPASRLAPLATIPYLFAAAAASSVLGILLTFTPPGLYPTYLAPLDRLGALPLIRGQWGLSPAVDQQVGGLLMWVPGSLVYLAGMMGALGQWYRTPEEDPLVEVRPARS